MSPLFRTEEPTRHPFPDPERLSNGLPFHGRPFQRRSPEIGRGAASAPVRESASLDTRTITAVNTPPKNTTSSPAVPATDCCRNPEDGICRQQTVVPNEEQPPSSPTRKPIRLRPSDYAVTSDECPRISPQTFRMHRFRHTESGAIERRPGFLPRQQRGGEHSWSYSNTSITASQRIRMSWHNCAGDNQISGQRAAAQAAP